MPSIKQNTDRPAPSALIASSVTKVQRVSSNINGNRESKAGLLLEPNMMKSCTLPPHKLSEFPFAETRLAAEQDPGRIVLGGGCFWCTEAVFLQLQGVTRVISGYAGGHPGQANYDAVCTGVTGHAEVIDIHYQPDQIGYTDLLRIFFAVAHDPTQLNRQGNDQGTQYRSAIFFASEQEKQVALAYIHQLDQGALFSSPIATTLEPLTEFYTAEQYHQNFVARNPHQGYVRYAALPKVETLQLQFPDLLKKE